MPADIEMPAWMRELLRLARHKSQLFVYGNIGDTVFYPLPVADSAGSTEGSADDEARASSPPAEAPADPAVELEGQAAELWTSADLRHALFDIAQQWLPGYSIVGSYSFIDGMFFADDDTDKKMAQRFAELVKGARDGRKSPPADVPQALKSDDPVDQALQRIREALLSPKDPCLMVIEHASQLTSNPAHLPLCERAAFMRMLLAAQQSPAVPVETAGGLRMVNNLVILLCHKLTDLPAWLYLNNPYSGVVELTPPRGAERQRFFETQCGPLAQRWDSAMLADLTDGMSYRDLIGVRSLAAEQPQDAPLQGKQLIDQFKYGRRDSEWDELEHERLADAEAQLSRRVMGQPHAVAAVSDVLRRAKLGLSGAQHSSRGKPRGVLFFAGPTGVGKTELAKAVAELVFNNEEALVRFDMSEYGHSHADQRLLGAPPGYVGYEEGGQLTSQLAANPFRVLLFDEIEKAHPSILDKFLQILEDGRLTDGRGQTVYFAESIIIFTSNAGIYQIDQHTGRPAVDPATGSPILNVDPNIHTDYEDVRTRVAEGVRSYFKHFLGRPELLNRIGNNVIVFDFVRQDTMRVILDRKVLKSIAALVAESHKVAVEFDPAVSDQLIELVGADISQGGRGVGNLAELAIVNPLARTLYELIGAHGSLAGRTLRVHKLLLPRAGETLQYGLDAELV